MIIAYIEFGIAIVSCVIYLLYSIWIRIPKKIDIEFIYGREEIGGIIKKSSMGFKWL